MTFARTKIQPPRLRAAFVERGQVQPRLAAALASQGLVLLCAPAGYGKTSALANEIASLPPGHAVAWISADAGDDLQRLLDCLVTALEPYDPPWRTAPEALVARAGRASADEQRELAAELINTLDAWAAALGAPATGAPAPSAGIDAGAGRFTARELEVLARIAASDSNKLIARAFDLSLHTVKRHVANILGKIGVESRGQAAAWYREHAG